MESIEKLREYATEIIRGGECRDVLDLADEIEREVAELLDAEKEKTAAANKAMNEATGKWAKADAENRELKKMLLIDDGTVEDYTERLDLQAALDRQKALADEFHEEWSEYRKACLELEEENDRLKREIAERYMELPVDADGVPIHVGDELTYGTVKCIRNTRRGWQIVAGYGCSAGGYDPSGCHHVKPVTAESLLREFVEKRFGMSISASDEYVREFAAKLEARKEGGE